MRRTRDEVLVRAGVHYSEPGPGKPAALETVVDIAGVTYDQLVEITGRVEAGMAGRLSEADAGHEEHRLQGTMSAHRSALSWDMADVVKREFPAMRPSGGTSFVDFLRLDREGVLHVVETKIGDDEMLVL